MGERQSPRKVRKVRGLRREIHRYQDEFLDLFQKNRYPVLKEELKRGRLTSVSTGTCRSMN